MQLVYLTGMKKAADREGPTTSKGLNEVSGLGNFGTALFDIGWRLAISVIIFLWGGNALDAKLGTRPLFSALGFLLIILSFILIVRQILQNLPRQYGGLKDD